MSPGGGAAEPLPRVKGREDLRLLARLLTGVAPGPDLDWGAMAGLAQRHKVAPLLFWRLSQGRKRWGLETRVPVDVWDRLQEDFYAAAGRALLAEWQLAEVLRAMAAAGVPAIVIKGAAIAAFYPDPALRSYSDLDILVPEAQLDVAETALNELGYRCFRWKDWWLAHFHHLPTMVSDDGRFAVELHWRVDHEEALGRLPAEDLWARAVPWTVSGQPALRLETVDTALHLCRHAAVQHRAKQGLGPLCDLAQVTTGWNLGEWEMMVQRAADYGLTRPVYLMLRLAEEAGVLAVPREVMSRLWPPGSRPLSPELARSFLHAGDGQAVAVPIAVVQAGAKGTAVARLRHMLWHLLLPRAGMAAIYDIPADSPRIWLAYLRRPVDLLRRYGGSVWGVLCGTRATRIAWQREAWLERWLTAGDQQDHDAA